MCVLMSIYYYMNLVEVDDEALQSEEVLLEDKNEYKGDKAQILLKGKFISTCVRLWQAWLPSQQYHTLSY